MRHALVSALALILSVTQAWGFETEAERLFGPENAPRIRVLGTTDLAFFSPVAEAFLAENPGLGIEYLQASSQAVSLAVDAEGAPFDLVISTAMDLQMKLANDGFARALPPDIVQRLPGWARWRDRLVSIALEPVVLLIAESALNGQPPPRSRRDLIALLRDHPETFAGHIGTYDPRISGAGYLFLTQDARMSDSIWRLAEVMGRLDARLYCCSGEVIEGLISGDLLVGYNVLGSYAAANLPEGSDVLVVPMEDFTITLQRTALIPVNAADPDGGAALLRFILSDAGQDIQAQVTGGSVMRPESFTSQPWLMPIRLDPGLLSSLDTMTRDRFLAEWTAALDQP
ncbi:ABC transporter substrate-binding protein [Pararhodobacter aggregans]